MKYKFSQAERHAVYTVHGEKCYISGEPLTFLTMEVDHIIPESLLENPLELEKVFAEFGLPKNFNLQSYANWKPACGPCNLKKRETIFRPTPLIQLHLQEASAKAEKAAQMATALVTNRRVESAWNVIERASEQGELSDDLRKAIEEFSLFHEQHRAPEAVGQLLRLTPLIEVLAEADGIRIVKGPYGIGGGPIHPYPSSRCGVCGGAEWNGARCVLCGNLNDD
jgi:5-methylcytosine-specific restriction endonuclease McrA